MGSFIKIILILSGWLICQSMCLYVTINLEVFEQAYERLNPIIIGIMFINMALFYIIFSRYNDKGKNFIIAILSACLSESILLYLLYFIGKTNFVL